MHVVIGTRTCNDLAVLSKRKKVEVFFFLVKFDGALSGATYEVKTGLKCKSSMADLLSAALRNNLNLTKEMPILYEKFNYSMISAHVKLVYMKYI